MKYTASFLIMLAAWALASPRAMAQVVINELMQSNIDCLLDDFREFPDSWVELHNTGSTPVTLNGYKLGLTINPDEAWAIPTATIPAGGFYLIYCDRENKGRHASFRLESGKGGSVYLLHSGAVIDQVVNLPKQPAPNIAYGRLTEGSDLWGYQASPTPGGANCKSLLDKILGEPTFSQTGCVLTTGKTLNVAIGLPDDAPAGTVIRYTIDGKEPTDASPIYSTPLTINKTTLVRAKLYCNGYLSPRSTTQSYIFHNRDMTLPVVSLVSDNDYFWGETLGILTGSEDDIGWTTSGNMIFPNYYYSWRRPVNIEYFTQSDQPSVINQLGETRLMGQSSRFYSIKSFVIYANKRFGTKRFQYEFFPEQKPGKNKFKSFMLRNAGNDLVSLYMRDAIIQRTMGMNADIDWQGYQPAVVYINGVYFGMLNLRERSNDAFIETNYGSEMADNIDMVEYWGEEIKAGDKAHWDEFVNFYSQAGHSLAEYEERIDLQEFNNIMAMNFYFNNYDFPGNNCVWWRPTQEGGRWRIIAKDCDFGLGLNNISYTFPIFEWFYNPGWALQNGVHLDAMGSNEWNYTVMFRNMMKNAEYKTLFTNMMAIYMGDFLNERGTRDIWDPMYEQIAQEIPYYQDAIPNYWERSNYPVALNDARNWIHGRTDFMYGHLANFYSLGTPIPLTINKELTPAEQDAIQVIVDGIPLQYGNFDGKMFARRTVTLTAQSSKYGITGWNVIQTDANGHTTQTQISGTDYEFTMPSSGSIAVNAMITSDILLGDVNSDGLVTIDDVTALIDMLLSGQDVDNIDAADVNGDNNIGIDDVTALIDLLLSGH